jgi:hypothetical protein
MKRAIKRYNKLPWWRKIFVFKITCSHEKKVLTYIDACERYGEYKCSDCGEIIYESDVIC